MVAKKMNRRWVGIAFFGLSSAALALSYRAVDVTLKFDSGPMTIATSTKASPTLGAVNPPVRNGVASVGASRGAGSWDVGLSPRFPLALHVQHSSGSQDMKLGGLPLTAFSLDMGSGPVNISFPSATFNAAIKHTSGSLDIHVPADTGLSLRINRFTTGSLEVDGETISVGSGLQGTYRTHNFDNAKRKITLALDWGSGPVTVHTPGK